MLLRLENCDSETVSNEKDPGDSLLSALASLTAPVSAMDGVNHYNWNCVVFEIIVSQRGGRWEAVTEVRREFPWEKMFTQRGLQKKTLFFMSANTGADKLVQNRMPNSEIDTENMGDRQLLGWKL